MFSGQANDSDTESYDSELWFMDSPEDQDEENKDDSISLADMIRALLTFNRLNPDIVDPRARIHYRNDDDLTPTGSECFDIPDNEGDKCPILAHLLGGDRTPKDVH